MGLCSKVIFSVFIRRNSTFRVKYKRKCENNENSRCCCSKSRDVKEKRQKTCIFFGLSPFWQAKIKLIQPRTSTKSKTCSVATNRFSLFDDIFLIVPSLSEKQCYQLTKNKKNLWLRSKKIYNRSDFQSFIAQLVL